MDEAVNAAHSRDYKPGTLNFISRAFFKALKIKRMEEWNTGAGKCHGCFFVWEITFYREVRNLSPPCPPANAKIKEHSVWYGRDSSVCRIKGRTRSLLRAMLLGQEVTGLWEIWCNEEQLHYLCATIGRASRSRKVRWRACITHRSDGKHTINMFIGKLARNLEYPGAGGRILFKRVLDLGYESVGSNQLDRSTSGILWTRQWTLGSIKLREFLD